MSTTIRAQVRIANLSTLSKDAIVNTWHFRSTSLLVGEDVNTAYDALVALYTALEIYFSPACNAFPEITFYDLSDDEPRTPLVSASFTFDPSGGTAMPNEVAICVSFHAAAASGVSPGRRRGRIYLGPFNTGVLATSDFGGIVGNAVGTAINDAVDTFWGTLDSGSCLWSVFSPSTAGPAPWTEGELSAATFPVVGGHVDNAFDTMRSRGIDATVRDTFGA
jgi:hypothetical protein